MAICLTSCVEDYECGLQIGKPGAVASSEYLAAFDVLKAYVSRDADSPFRLTVNMSPDDFVAHEIAYSTAVDNFDGLDIGGAYMPVNSVDQVGDYDFSGMTAVADAARTVGVTLYGGTLASCQGQRAAYYTEQFKPVTVTYDPVAYTYFDFERDELGTAYPMSSNSTAVVATDPDDPDNKVLYVGTENDKANQSFPIFHVRLPEGHVLGDYINIGFDIRIVNNDGMWGAGMRVFINGQSFSVGVNAQQLGCNANQWNRNAVIKMNDATAPGFVLPDGMKDLTEFELRIGSASGAAQFYLDNIYMTYTSSEIIEKTPEEKAAFLLEDMRRWIGGMINAGGGTVTVWNIMGEPLSHVQDDGTFDFGEYLGSEQAFVRTAVRMARDTAQTPLQLFVSNTFEYAEDWGEKAERLIASVDAYESDGSTVIDGYNILLHAVWSKNASLQAGNEAMLTDLFTRLARTGKAVRISALSVSVEDEGGSLLSARQVSEDDRAQAAAYLRRIIQIYRNTIDPTDQYGISLSGMIESASGTALCPWTSTWNRNAIYEGVVNGLVN